MKSFFRARLFVALLIGRTVAFLSRFLGKGDGTVIGGRVLMLLIPDGFQYFLEGLKIYYVTGTNGKSTTVAMITELLSAESKDSVLSNSEGANLPYGILWSLSKRKKTHKYCVLEVDERYLGLMLGIKKPDIVVLTNLSRDQLDRMSEVRQLAKSLHNCLDESTKLVTLSDDPVSTYVGMNSHVSYVETGLIKTLDSKACPRCGGLLTGNYICSNCGFEKPNAAYKLRDSLLEIPAGALLNIELSLPGEFNKCNASLAIAAVDLTKEFRREAALNLKNIKQIGGRYKAFKLGNNIKCSLYLAKNPAGYNEVLSMLSRDDRPIIFLLNAKTADGQDTSWIYDIDFGLVKDRRVFASGERVWDMTLCLIYNFLNVIGQENLKDAVKLASFVNNDIAVVANYTAFLAARKELELLEKTWT